ncbi:MAG: cation diffusion facilitator family transporter [Bacteroidales bacterium]|nr:cation diffusion facilitator family transporter [Bacteroidales bacterium]
MAHDHTKGIKNIRTAFLLNFIFTLIEIAGGLLTNSIAIISDALHDLGDSLSLGLAWYFQKISSRKRDQTYSFGYRRFTVLGALINSAVLLVGSVFILTEAIPRLLEPETVNARGMFVLAIIGIIANGLAAYKMRHGKSMNEKVVSLHLLEDVLGWGAVLIGSVVLHFTGLAIIDPILSIGITLYILINVIRNLVNSLKIFLQAVPPDINIDNIKHQIEQMEGVYNIHDIHIWSLDGEYNILTIHIIVDQPMQLQDAVPMKTRIRKMVRDMGIQHVTIETELSEEDCDQNC